MAGSGERTWRESLPPWVLPVLLALGGAGGGTVLTSVRSHVSVEAIEGLRALAVSAERRIAVLEEQRHAEREELLQWRGELALRLQHMAEQQATAATAASAAAAAAAAAALTAATAVNRPAVPR